MQIAEKRTISTLAEAETLLRESEGKVILCTKEASSAYMGIPYFVALEEKLHKNFKDKDFELILDCGANAGEALSALSYGVKKIIFRGNKEAFNKLQSIAKKTNTEIITDI